MARPRFALLGGSVGACEALMSGGRCASGIRRGGAVLAVEGVTWPGPLVLESGLMLFATASAAERHANKKTASLHPSR